MLNRNKLVFILAGILFAISSISAVSYTHLDVYKRQITYTVTLRDANYKDVASKEFKTDRFGSFNGEFTIPAQTLSGNFTLVTERSRTNIRVEEYKRPTFKVSFLPLKEEVSFGHPVKLTGEAQTFSGINLQEGEINWTITRRPFWARFYMPDPFDFTYQQVCLLYTSRCV